MGILDGHLDEFQDSGVVGIEEVREHAAGAVDHQRVLGQVIGTDGEEVHFLGQAVADESGGRGLHHDADFHVMVIGDALLVQLQLHFRQDFLGLPHFPYRGDEGEHDGCFAEGAGAKDGAELGLEDFRALQGNTDGPHAQSRIVFLRQVEGGGFLVGADVQGTDDDSLASHGLDGELVNIKLLFFAGEGVAAHVNEFTAEEADAFGVVLQHSGEVRGGGDVRCHFHLVAVDGFAGEALQLLQELFQADALILFLLHDGEDARCRFYVSGAGEAIDDSRLAVGFIGHVAAGGHDGRHAESPCKDGGVRGGGAFFGDEAQNLRGVHLDGFAGGQVVSVEDAWLIGGEESLLLLQRAQKDAGDFHHVGELVIDVGAIVCLVNADEILLGLGDGVLRIDALLADDGFHGVHKFGVRQHLLVHFENRSVVEAHMRDRFLVELLHLRASGVAGRVEASHFRLRLLHFHASDVYILMTKYTERPDGDHSGNTFSMDL